MTEVELLEKVKRRKRRIARSKAMLRELRQMGYFECPYERHKLKREQAKKRLKKIKEKANDRS